MLQSRVAGALAVLALCAVACSAGREPSRDETLVVVYPAATPWEEESVALNGNVLEPLVDLDANQQPQPALASNWYNPDDHTWVFELRPGLRRHDGQPVDAPQVVAALEQLRQKPGLAAAVFRPVESLRAIDAQRIELRTRRVYGPLVYQLMLAMPSFGGSRDQPLGTGPYRVESREPGRITLVAAETASPRPAIRRVRFEVVKDGTERVRRLLSGEAHLALDVPATESEALRRSPGHRLVVRRGLRLLFLGFDCARASWLESPGGPNPFRDARVRRAVALAVDRQRLARETLGGLATPCDQVVASEVFGYHTHLPRIPHDPAQARRLLAEAGWSQGFGVALDFMPGKYRAIDAVLASVSSDLARVGVTVRPQPADPGLFFDRLARQETSLYLMGWMSSSGDAGITLEYLLHSPGPRYGVSNGSGFSDPALDALLEQAASQVEARQRLPLLQQAAELVHESLPVVPLYRQTDLYGVAEGLVFEPRLDRRVRGFDLRWGDAAR